MVGLVQTLRNGAKIVTFAEGSIRSEFCMNNGEKKKILWVDDEIDLLKPHILFLHSKGYEVVSCISGNDAVEKVSQETYDLILLDEQMTGLGGLDTLLRIRLTNPFLPIVMVTKSEEEQLMNEAIGREIADFLIKPVNPNQLLLSVKKVLQKESLVSSTTMRDYNLFFRELSDKLSRDLSIEEWIRLYGDLAQWQIEIDEHYPELTDFLEGQKNEAERLFTKMITKNYKQWLSQPDNRPILSPDLFKHKVFPLLDRGEKVFFVLIDNFRWDQWLSVKDLLGDLYSLQEDMYMAILPTATQYARNAIFSGLMPNKIAQMFPSLWVDEESEEGKNINEEPLIATLLERYRRKETFSYHKVYDASFGEKLLSNLHTLGRFDLNVIVLNFVDMLSHARTESKMIRELAHTPAAYRSLTRSWFKHSTTYSLFKQMAEMGYKVILTTDHGTITVKKPIKVIGDRNTSTNLRYKLGRNLSYDPNEVFVVDNPESVGLPKSKILEKFIFCSENNFFAYPNNYNHYVKYYRDTFQHGGISLEEMLVPIITMQAK